MTDPSQPPSEILSGDHEDLDQRWEEIEATPPDDLAARRRRFDAFRDDLLGHISVEEERLFPLMQLGGPAERVLVDRLLEEHRRVRDILGDIDRAIAAGVHSLQALGFELVNILGEHNAREEAQAYPWLDGHLTPQQVLEVTRALGAREPQRLRRAQPHVDAGSDVR